MASNTIQTENKRARNHRNAGKKRKLVESRKSTPSFQELFAACGEPGKPVKK